DRPNFIDKVLNFSIKLIDPQRILDGIDHVEEIKYSDLDWTIVRVLKLQNTRPTSFRLTEGGPAKLITSRVEVAKACLEVLEKNEFMQKAPIISKG
ncbi:NAD(P)H-binding protein, partial [Candidatus Saccharibacteria bacterium]|nr:NAD(P)H-binding protein [Candidatus Saccharibacteria bacterium]